MTIYYNTQDRKPLVKAISEFTGADAVYMRTPTYAYQIDYFTVTRDGNLEFDDRADSEEIEGLIEFLAERGFIAEVAATSATEPLGTDTEEVPAAADSAEQTVGCADEYTSGFTLFELTGNIQHTFSGCDHVINDNNIFALYGITEEFVSNDRVFAVDNSGIVAAFVEHTHIYAKNIGKVYGS